MRNWRLFSGILVNSVLSLRDKVMFRQHEIDMNNTNKQCKGVGQLVWAHLVAGGILASALYAGVIHAAGEVSQVQTSDQPGTPTQYTMDGRTFHWGMGENTIMEGFTVQGQSYEYAGNADRVELVRHDVNNVSTGNPCGVFVERLGSTSGVLKANYPSDGSDTGNCDMAAMLAGRVVNRGALDLFSNTGPNPKNVERVDYLYDTGVLAPLTASALALGGHVVAEKSGNNPLQIAAVTKLDVLGQPAAFGPLIMVDRNGCSGSTICYGITNLRHNYSFFQNNSFAPQGYPSYLRDSTEPVGMAFVSLAELGIAAGQVYYGFSYFADDVDPGIHTLTDVTTFPSDTNDEKIVFGDGPDIYGGVAGYYLETGLSTATGAAFKDENGDSQLGENEAGISDVGLTLFQDTNGNGVFDPDEDAQMGQTFNSDANGEFNIPGLEDGVYFLLLDESDTDMPPALNVAPGSNPAMIVIQGNDADGVNFEFISDTGPTEGTDAGATDAGTDADAGEVDAGTAGEEGGTDGGVQDDPVETVAMPDSATVNQGAEVIIDVLANDTDASGQGLTIVGTPEANNGTVVVEEGDDGKPVLVYKPDFGFIGMDSFTYVIEDSAGTQNTGTVSVEVVRFVDLDKNGENDFVECGCDNLTIEIGLEGSAVGGPSLLSFLILTFMVGARRVFRPRYSSTSGVLK